MWIRYTSVVFMHVKCAWCCVLGRLDWSGHIETRDWKVGRKNGATEEGRERERERVEEREEEKEMEKGFEGSSPITQNTNIFFRRNNILFKNWARDILSHVAYIDRIFCSCFACYYVTIDFVHIARSTEKTTNTFNTLRRCAKCFKAHQQWFEIENWKSHKCMSFSIELKKKSMPSGGNSFGCMYISLKMFTTLASANLSNFVYSNLPGKYWQFVYESKC